MELIMSLIIVFFFVLLNEVRVAFVGRDNRMSEFFMLLSSIVAGVFLGIVA